MKVPTEGTIQPSRTTVVAGHAACCQHGNGKRHIVFVNGCFYIPIKLLYLVIFF